MPCKRYMCRSCTDNPAMTDCDFTVGHSTSDCYRLLCIGVVMLLTRSALFTPLTRSAAPSARCQTSRCCRPAALRSAFTPARSSISSLTSGFAGLTLQSAQRGPVRGRGTFLVQAKNHGSMGCTLQGTRRRRTRTSGFRTRRLTVGGRKVIKNRRKRGRHTICPASNYKK